MIPKYRIIYFNTVSGDIILDTGVRYNKPNEKTINIDISNNSQLSIMERDKFDYIILENNQYEADFFACTSYRVNPSTKEIEFSYPSVIENEDVVYQKPLSVQIQELELKLMSADEIYSVKVLDENITLDDLKQLKHNQLDEKCQQVILGRFKTTIQNVEYELSYDMEAQSNITSAGVLFFTGKIKEIEWTVYENGVRKRIPLSATDFEVLAFSALTHKNTNIVHFNELIKQLDECKSKDEVIAIEW